MMLVLLIIHLYYISGFILTLCFIFSCLFLHFLSIIFKYIYITFGHKSLITLSDKLISHKIISCFLSTLVISMFLHNKKHRIVCHLSTLYNNQLLLMYCLLRRVSTSFTFSFFLLFKKKIFKTCCKLPHFFSIVTHECLKL
jgi:hypothetical protein